MSKILLWLQERLKLWTKPATSVMISGILSDLTRSHADLVVENALLRRQLMILKRQVKRPQLTNADRIHLVLLAHFTKFWKQTLHIIQPDTLCAGYFVHPPEKKRIIMVFYPHNFPGAAK